MLDDGSTRREVTLQDRHCAFLLQRRGEGSDDVLTGNYFCLSDGIADSAAGDAGRVEVEKWDEFAHQRGQAAGMVEMLHVVRAGWLEVEEDGNVAA